MAGSSEVQNLAVELGNLKARFTALEGKMQLLLEREAKAEANKQAAVEKPQRRSKYESKQD